MPTKGVLGGWGAGIFDTNENTPRMQVPTNTSVNNETSYSGEISFQTTGSSDNAPWNIMVANGGTNRHDHILHHLYNCRWNESTQGWETIVAGSHCIRYGMESRYTTSDPQTVRGSLEWNLDVSTSTAIAAGGTVTFPHRPWFLAYNMDTRLAQVNIGDSTDTSSAFMSLGQSSTYNIVVYDGQAGRPNVFGSNSSGRVTSASDANTITKLGRLCIAPDAAIVSGDRAAYIRTAGSVGQSLVLEAGKDGSDVVGDIHFGLTNVGSVYCSNQQFQVNASGVISKINNASMTITSGSGIPTATLPQSSLYLRTDATAAGSRVYVSAGGGSWNAIAGV